MDESDFLERLKNTGRNDPCPCGSGKKYKKCHLESDESKRHEVLAEQEELRAAEATTEDEEKDDSTKGTKQTVTRNERMSPGGINRAGRSHLSQNIPRRSAK